MGNMGVLILLALSVTFLEVSFAFRPVHHGSKMSNLKMSLGSTHDALFDKLSSEFDLKRTDYTDAMGGADLLVGSLKAECACSILSRCLFSTKCQGMKYFGIFWKTSSRVNETPFLICTTNPIIIFFIRSNDIKIYRLMFVVS